MTEPKMHPLPSKAHPDGVQKPRHDQIPFMKLFEQLGEIPLLSRPLDRAHRVESRTGRGDLLMHVLECSAEALQPRSACRAVAGELVDRIVMLGAPVAGLRRRRRQGRQVEDPRFLGCQHQQREVERPPVADAAAATQQLVNAGERLVPVRNVRTGTRTPTRHEHLDQP